MKIVCICISLVLCFNVVGIAQQQDSLVIEKRINYFESKINFNPSIQKIKPNTVTLFKPLPNAYQNKKRPLFCELEHQLSSAINKKVKFGVEPTTK